MAIYLNGCALGKEEYTDILRTIRHRVYVNLTLGKLKSHYGPTTSMESHGAR